MLAGDGPVWIARDRVAGAQRGGRGRRPGHRARRRPPEPGAEEDPVAWSSSTARPATTNGPSATARCFPSGPMREPLKAGLARADAVVMLLPADLAEPDPELLALFGAMPVLHRPARARRAAAARARRSASPASPSRGRSSAPCAPPAATWSTSPPSPTTPPSDDGTCCRPSADRADRSAPVWSPPRRTGSACRPTGATRVAAWPVQARFEDEAAFAALLQRRSSLPSVDHPALHHEADALQHASRRSADRPSRR